MNWIKPFKPQMEKIERITGAAAAVVMMNGNSCSMIYFYTCIHVH